MTLVLTAPSQTVNLPIFIPGTLFGLTLSTAGSSATFGIATGLCANSTATDYLALTSAYTKTTSAWALGTAAGALDTGAIANSTWYHVFLIKRPDTGVVDVLISLSATAPTLPTNYTLFRRIGSMQTNGSAQWASFAQYGDWFYIASVSNWTPGGGSHAAALRTLSIPLGVVVQPLLAMSTVGGGNASSQITVAPAANAALIATYNGSYEGQAGGDSVYSTAVGPHSNTSSQIYIGAIVQYGASVNTYGWVDTRGRDF